MNDFLFLDKSGFLSGKGSNDFGDMRWSPISKQVWFQLQKDIEWTETTTPDRFAAYIPKYGQTWLMPDWYDDQGTHTTQRCYILNMVSGAWTWYEFGVKITAVRQIDNDIYLGDENGRLYKMDESILTDDGTAFTTKYLTACKIKEPFTNKLLRKYLVDMIGLTTSSTNQMTVKIYKDLKYSSAVLSKTLQFANNQSTDLSKSVKTHSAKIGFTALQFGIERVTERVIAGPIILSILTYGEK